MADLLSTGVLAESIVDITTSGTALALSPTSATVIRLNGGVAQTIVLPDATTCFDGMRYFVINRSSATCTIQYSDFSFAQTILFGEEREIRLMDGGTAVGDWDFALAKSTSETVPFKIYADSPPTTVLNIDASEISTADSTKIASPIKDVVVSIPATTIDFDTEVISGASVLDGFNGPTLTFPATLLGNYRRLVFTAQYNSTIAAKFSAQDAVLANLPNAGAILKPLKGLAIGYIDLQCTSVAPVKFKTANSLTNVIENSVGGIPTVLRFTGGGGGGTSSSKYNKIIGPDDYGTIAAAGIVDGDTVLVAQNLTITATETISANNVLLDFLPSVSITCSSITIPLILSGTGIQLVAPRIIYTGTGTAAAGIRITGNYCTVTSAYFEINASGAVVTNVYHTTGSHNSIFGTVNAVLGTYGFGFTDAGTDNVYV